MKNTVSILLALFIMVAASSCAKKYTCKCTTTDPDTGEVIGEKDFSYRGKDTRHPDQRADDCTTTATQIDDMNARQTVTTCKTY